MIGESGGHGGDCVEHRTELGGNLATSRVPVELEAECVLHIANAARRHAR